MPSRQQRGVQGEISGIIHVQGPYRVLPSMKQRLD